MQKSFETGSAPLVLSQFVLYTLKTLPNESLLCFSVLNADESDSIYHRFLIFFEDGICYGFLSLFPSFPFPFSLFPFPVCRFPFPSGIFFFSFPLPLPVPFLSLSFS